MMEKEGWKNKNKQADFIELWKGKAEEKEEKAKENKISY